MAQTQAEQPLKYLYDIASIQEVNPELPPIVSFFDLTSRIKAGTVLESRNIAEAKCLANGLRVVKGLGLDPRITDAVVESAELRVKAVEAAHASRIYAPTDMNQALRNLADQLKAIPKDVFAGSNGHSDTLQGRVDEFLALAHNRRIAAFNRTQKPADYKLLEKTVAGHGLALATAAFGHVPSLLPHLVAPSVVPAIGTVPSDFDQRYQSERTIIDLIIFYNENFGIIAGDSVEQCFDKFYSFMTIL